MKFKFYINKRKEGKKMAERKPEINERLSIKICHEKKKKLKVFSPKCYMNIQ